MAQTILSGVATEYSGDKRGYKFAFEIKGFICYVNAATATVGLFDSSVTTGGTSITELRYERKDGKPFSLANIKWGNGSSSYASPGMKIYGYDSSGTEIWKTGFTIPGASGNGVSSDYDMDQSTYQKPFSYILIKDGTYLNAKYIHLTTMDYTKGVYATPVPSINYVNKALGSLAVNRSYRINGVNYTANADGEIPILEEWMGTSITIRQNGDDYNDASPDGTFNIPSPNPITVETLNIVNGLWYNWNGFLYRIKESGEYVVAAGTMGEAIELEDATTYEFKKAASASGFESNVVEYLVSKLPTRETPVITVNTLDEKLEGFSTEGTHTIYVDNFPEVISPDSEGKVNVKAAWIGKLVNIKHNGVENTINDSEIINLQIPERLVITADEIPVKGSTTINNLPDGVQYRLNGTDEWTDVESNSLTVGDFGTYDFRKKSTAEAFCSLPITVEVEPDKIPPVIKRIVPKGVGMVIMVDAHDDIDPRERMQYAVTDQDVTAEGFDPAALTWQNSYVFSGLLTEFSEKDFYFFAKDMTGNISEPFAYHRKPWPHSVGDSYSQTFYNVIKDPMQTAIDNRVLKAAFDPFLEDAEPPKPPQPIVTNLTEFNFTIDDTNKVITLTEYHGTTDTLNIPEKGVVNDVEYKLMVNPRMIIAEESKPLVTTFRSPLDVRWSDSSTITCLNDENLPNLVTIDGTPGWSGLNPAHMGNAWKDVFKNNTHIKDVKACITAYTLQGTFYEATNLENVELYIINDTGITMSSVWYWKDVFYKNSKIKGNFFWNILNLYPTGTQGEDVNNWYVDCNNKPDGELVTFYSSAENSWVDKMAYVCSENAHPRYNNVVYGGADARCINPDYTNWTA